jgi:hypothetical protein
MVAGGTVSLVPCQVDCNCINGGRSAAHGHHGCGVVCVTDQQIYSRRSTNLLSSTPVWKLQYIPPRHTLPVITLSCVLEELLMHARPYTPFSLHASLAGECKQCYVPDGVCDEGCWHACGSIAWMNGSPLFLFAGSAKALANPQTKPVAVPAGSMLMLSSSAPHQSCNIPSRSIIRISMQRWSLTSRR